jgi:signal peptidase I
MEPVEVGALGAPVNQPVNEVPLVAQPVRRADSVSLGDAIESLLVTILLALFGTTFIVQAFKIPSESMEPTLLVGDHLLVNKFIFEGTGAWYDKVLPYRPIARGDIIIFKFPYEDHPDYVKRVIGLPGDRVRILDDQVMINGIPLVEPYAEQNLAEEDAFARNFPPTDGETVAGVREEWAKQIPAYTQGDELAVPPNHYFVLGDNREDSLDSRYWGFVDRSAVIGRPVVIYWSVRADADEYTDRSVYGSVAAIFDTLIHLPSRTRWGRLLREVH